MMKHELYIALISLSIGMIVAFYVSIFAIGLDCEPKAQKINFNSPKGNQVTLQFNPPK